MTATPPEPQQPFGAGQTPYPGPQQPAAPYGAYPTLPGGQPPQRQAPPAQPSSIALAVKLMYAGAALGILSLIYTLATVGTLKDRVADQMRDADPSIKQTEIDAFYVVSIVIAIVSAIVVVALWSWMAWKNGQGRSWARVVATVLAALNLLFIPFTIYTARSEPVSLVASLVNVILAIVILVLLWKKESSHFYKAADAARRPY
jgi:dipeptide/tripeptide permease